MLAPVTLPAPALGDRAKTPGHGRIDIARINCPTVARARWRHIRLEVFLPIALQLGLLVAPSNREVSMPRVLRLAPLALAVAVCFVINSLSVAQGAKKSDSVVKAKARVES